MAPESERAMEEFDFEMRVVERASVLIAKLYGQKHADGGEYAPILSSSDKPLLREIARRWNAARPTLTCSEVVERLAKCKWCDKPIHKVRRYNSAGNEYFEQWAHALDDDATCTIMVEPADIDSWRERRVQELEEALRVIVEYHTIPAGYWSSRYPGLDDVVDIREGEEKPCWLQMAERALAKSDEWREQIRKGAKHE